MALTIRKFDLTETTDDICVRDDAEFIHLELSGNTPVLYAQVDLNKPSIFYRYHCIPTGGTVPTGSKHVGSFKAKGHMWHLYIKKA